MTRATLLALQLAASPVFWLGVSAGLAIAAAVLACTVLVDAARERRARRAAAVYRGKRRKPRRPVTAEALGAMSVAAMQAKATQPGAVWAQLRATTQEDERATLTGDTQPLPPARPASPHGHPRPVPPWAGRSERPGIMARLGGWHR